jgi:uncharacterized protein (DUF608 family)
MKEDADHEKALKRSKSPSRPDQNRIEVSGIPCDCESGGCCGPSQKGLGRRQFLKVAGVGIVSTTLGGRLTGIMAGPFAAAETKSGYLIPEDKKLSEAWVRSLFERGAKDVFKGKSLDKIGMPCGGIGAGQLYLCGDGTLGCWEIFNNAQSNWVEGTNATYKHVGIAKPVDQGFAVVVDSGDGKPVLRTLNREGFTDVSFTGEYPIGLVRYEEPGCPVKVEMEVFSPFIPLNAKDSALPATVFHITVENASQKRVSASVMGWLQNAVCNVYARESEVLRKTRYVSGNGFTICLHSAEESPKPEPGASPPRRDIVFEKFEGKDYGKWQVEGEAFGKSPAHGAFPKQGTITGFEGKGLVNSFLMSDAPQGTLTSPPFAVSRRYINFLIAGGSHENETCINLLIDGKVVRTSAGRNSNEMKWRSWLVDEFEGREARIQIVDKISTSWGCIEIDQIEFSDTPRVEGQPPASTAPDYGTMALACAEAGPREAAQAGPLPANRPADEFIVEEIAAYASSVTRRALLRTTDAQLAPGEKHTFTFVLAWHFPNLRNGEPSDVAAQGSKFALIGHEYENRFADAAKVAEYILQNHDRLTGDTRLWRDAYYDSSLPYWLLDRLHSTVSYLATGTCQWWKNGRFWAYEGVSCCHGTCTHVWNYAHSNARLFPELERSAREMQDFNPRDTGGGFHPDTGLVGFRSDDNYAADGQCGTILKAYREHLMSADDSFLKRNWPSIKKALEFSILHDGNADGLIEDQQHNTYDINFFGPNTFVGSLYLAALRAAEEMAKEVGDLEFAKRVRAIFESGTRLTEARLWNGEYFVQEVDLKEHPKHQYKDGCLSDQLFGQGWAHQLDLGYIYTRPNVLKALESIWKYNWAPDVGPYNEVFKPFRWFVTPGQAGLITCTWPKGDYLSEGVLYREEVWTGIEYQVAGHMIWEGKLLEGLAICRAVQDRYHPDLFNPYNEVECGDHYARAMASWGVYLALAGFRYNGPRGWLGFGPRISPDNFRAAFTTAEGWIAFQQTRNKSEQKDSIEVRWGKLRLTRLSFETEGTAKSAHVTCQGKKVKAKAHAEKGRVTLEFEKELLLQAGEKLEATLRS